MHQFFGHVLCAKNKSKTSYHFLAFTFQIVFLANGNESRNSMQCWRQRVVNWSLVTPIRSAGACNLAWDQITPANVHEEV